MPAGAGHTRIAEAIRAYAAGRAEVDVTHLDAMAFVIVNPAFGWRRFKPVHVTWHKRWAFGAPVDYWIFGALGIVLLRYAF